MEKLKQKWKKLRSIKNVGCNNVKSNIMNAIKKLKTIIENNITQHTRKGKIGIHYTSLNIQQH